MMPAIRLAQAIRRRYLPPDAASIRAARAIARWSLARVYPHGVPVRIGTAGTFRIMPELAVGSLDYGSWGSGKNSGFASWVDACRGTHAVLDIGAHIGLYTLPASRVLAPDGHCYAFEPAAANVAALERHIALNHCENITIVPMLVGAEDRDAVPFFEQSSVVGMNSVVATDQTARYPRTVRPQTTLDTYCTAHRIAPDVVKIDVEGGELGVLDGARAILASARPRVWLSVHPRHLACLGTSTDALAACIAELGYRVTAKDGNPADVRTTTEVILEPLRACSL